MTRSRSLRPPSKARSLTLALAGPAVAIGLGLAIDRQSVVGATSLCLLAVVLAAAYGGRRAGLSASVLAFLALNFFFTVPYHTFIVARAGDVIALLVFLAVSLVVGALLSRALEERERAERRAAEVHFLDRMTSKLISGEAIDEVLGAFARDVAEMFGLARCEIRLPGGHPPIAAGAAWSGEGPGTVLEVPLGPEPGGGSLVATRTGGGGGFGQHERSFLRSLAGQAGLALERAALDGEVTEARVESEANRTRAALFSSVTHDLKTPLASIKAGAGGLLGDPGAYTPEQRDEMLRTVVEEADRLDRIVANLLDLARMRAGSLAPAREPLWLGDIVGAVLVRMRRRLEGFPVSVRIREDLPPVIADPLQMDQLLTNILENAARFSPPGGAIEISASCWHGAVELRISDHGPGIPEDERTRVFEEFYRRDSGPGRGGTGLGLAIARAIVQAHGGRIWAEGAPGGGTTIALRLPAEAATAQVLAEGTLR